MRQPTGGSDGELRDAILQISNDFVTDGVVADDYVIKIVIPQQT
ncbi:MAG: hypothetical protein ACRECX_03055 [Methyloceanibacter sp.]